MTPEELRQQIIDKYKSILGRNKYSQDRRGYVYKKYTDGRYYSDCSSSIAATYRECGCPISYGGSTLPNTVGMYLSEDLIDVPAQIKNGVIRNPEVLRPGDMLLFAGTDSSRAYAGYVGHVEMVAIVKDGGSKVTIYGHGSGTPRATEMNAYCKSRYSQKTSTKLGHKGLIKVRRRIADDAEPPKLGERELKEGMTGSDVKELQERLIALGYDCGPDGADGDFGPNTRLALKAFQTVRDLNASGVADAQTIAALLAARSEPPAPTGDVAIANCTTCNIRTGPGAEYGIAGTAKPGDSFTLVKTDGWMPIKYYGNICWVSSKYAERGGDRA